MKPWERQRALAVAKDSKGQDWDALSPFAQQELAKINPAYVAKEQRATAEKSSEYKELQRLGFVEDGKIGDTQKQQVDLQKLVRESTVAAEAAAAEKLGTVLGNVLKEMSDSFLKKIETECEKIKAGLKQGKA